jgi:hypothetical protein
MRCPANKKGKISCWILLEDETKSRILFQVEKFTLADVVGKFFFAVLQPLIQVRFANSRSSSPLASRYIAVVSMRA